MPKKVTPIKMENGKAVECPPITIDWGNLVGNEKIEINGKLYSKITLMDIDAPKYGEEPYSEFIVKESPKSFYGG